MNAAAIRSALVGLTIPVRTSGSTVAKPSGPGSSSLRTFGRTQSDRSTFGWSVPEGEVEAKLAGVEGDRIDQSRRLRLVEGRDEALLERDNLRRREARLGDADEHSRLLSDAIPPTDLHRGSHFVLDVIPRSGGVRS